MQPTVLLILMTSCLTYQVIAETQSARTASSHFGASLAQTATQRQQRSSTHPLHSASNELALSDGKVNSSSAYQSLTPNQFKNNWLDFSKSSDAIFTDKFQGGNTGSHSGAGRYSQTYRTGDVNNGYVEDSVHAPTHSNWGRPQLQYKDHVHHNNYNAVDTTFSHDGSVGETGNLHESHRVYKRESSSGDDQAESDLLGDTVPVLVDRRYQLFRPSSTPYQSPYLSPQEFKETFRRSDPYFMGKRTYDLLPDEEDKRDAPKFVGRRDPPYFVGKRESLSLSENDLLEYSSPEDESSLLEDKRAAPKFVGRRGAPYFVGKRGAPKFVGKRNAVFQTTDDDILSLEDKRAAPKFVGRRGAPFFVGKRDSLFPWNEFSSEDISQLLEDKRAAPKFVGRRGAPYFVGKRSLPIYTGKQANVFEFEDEEPSLLDNRKETVKFLGRRGSPYFVGKRGAPKFVGRRGAPKFVGRRAAPYFVGKRAAPKFVGKRGAPKFVGKRWSELQDQSLSNTDEKRAAPKFVGRRGSPYFVGKREPSEILYEFASLDKEPLLESKRAAPKFVGRRGAPYFVGKRGPPMFVGKRTVDEDWFGQNNLLLEDKRAAPKFVGRRGAPYFVGKRGAPVFVGKRDELDNEITSEAEQEKLTGGYEKEANGYIQTVFSGKETSESNSLLSSGKTVSDHNSELWDSLNRLQAIESLKERVHERRPQELSVDGSRNNNQVQENTAADQTGEQR